MISKQTEQKAEILKLVGFALLTPFGRICIEPIVVFKEFGFAGFLCYAILSFIIGTGGINCIARSYEILEERRTR